MTVPCGKCRACRIAKAREWATRIVHELQYHDSAVFVTLTFADEKLPPDLSVNKRVVQCWIKRLRKAVEPRRIRYYVCGEYGERSGRCHYHAILFGVSRDERKTLERTWPHGFVYLGTVTYESARYVADYMQKGQLVKDEYNGRKAPFILMSKGLGKEFALENASRLKRDLGCTIQGVQCGLPRYYVKKLEIDSLELLARGDERRKEVKELAEKRGLDDEETWIEVQRSRDQARRNVEAKSRTRQRSKV